MKGYQRRSASTRNLDARSRTVPGWDLNKGPLPPPSLRLTTSPLKIERAQLTNPRIFASHLWVRVVYAIWCMQYQLVVDLVWLSSRDQRSARDDYSNR